MILFRLLRIISLSHLRAERLKTALAFLGLSLGIALFIAIRLANESAWAGFADSVGRIAPQTPLRVVGDGGGVPESLIPKLLAIPGVETVSPLLIGYATGRSAGHDLGFVEVLGIDPMSFSGWSRRGEGNAPKKTKGQAESPISQQVFVDLLRKPTGALLSEGLAKEKQLSL